MQCLFYCSFSVCKIKIVHGISPRKFKSAVLFDLIKKSASTQMHVLKQIEIK